MRMLARNPIKKIFLDLGSTSVTTAAWVQLVASMEYPVSAITIFNGSASVIKMSLGAAGLEDASEIAYYIVPGSNDVVLPIEIGRLKRISLKAQDVDATSGSFVINCFG